MHISNAQCICWPCKKILVRKATDSSNKENDTQIQHMQCSVTDCKESAVAHCPPNGNI